MGRVGSPVRSPLRAGHGAGLAPRPRGARVDTHAESGALCAEGRATEPDSVVTRSDQPLVTRKTVVGETPAGWERWPWGCASGGSRGHGCLPWTGQQDASMMNSKEATGVGGLEEHHEPSKERTS